jgi:pyridoxal phosphate enzyme (YggS family)
VTLIAVSKTVSPERMREAIYAGQRVFGENYLQEALAKSGEFVNESVDGKGVELHCIGHLQRNKVREAVKLFEVIHTVDSIKLCEEIQKEALRIGKVQKVLLQVNVAGEESKWGATEGEAETLLRHALALPNVQVLGLMTIGEFHEETASDAVRRRDFIRLRALRDRLAASVGRELPELSMGMSHDFELAIEEGATAVRVGSAIFGARQ